MSFTAYKIVTADIGFADALAVAVATAITGGWQPLGGPVVLGSAKVAQAMVQGTADGAGAGGAIAIGDVTGLQAALDAKADATALASGLAGKLATNGVAASATKLATARTIAGHAFDGTANITITAGDVGATPA